MQGFLVGEGKLKGGDGVVDSMRLLRCHVGERGCGWEKGGVVLGALVAEVLDEDEVEGDKGEEGGEWALKSCGREAQHRVTQGVIWCWVR